MVVAAVLALVGSASAGAEPTPRGPVAPQLNTEATFLVERVATADPCIFASVWVDVLDFTTPPHAGGVYTLADGVYFSVGVWDSCTNDRALYDISLPVEETDGLVTIDEPDFVVSHGYDIARLTAAVPGYDYRNLAPVVVVFDLQWRSTRGVSEAAASVAGTVSFAGFTIVLDDSINWNPWGSELGFPWAGIWPCRHGGGQSPGCINQ